MSANKLNVEASSRRAARKEINQRLETFTRNSRDSSKYVFRGFENED